MKVLLISDNHLCKGGAEQYFYDLKNQLKSRNDLEVVTLTFGWDNHLSGPDYMLKAPKIKFLKFFWQVFYHPILYRRLKKLINAIDADIIHIHNVKQYTPTVCKALQGAIIIQTIHDYGAVCPVAWNIHKNGRPCETGMTRECFDEHHVKHPYLIYITKVYTFLKFSKWQKNWVRYFLTPSPHLASLLTKKFSQPVRYMQPFLKNVNALEINKNSAMNAEFRNELANRSSPPTFLFVGNIGRHKGVLVLLEEFAIAIKKNPHLRLMIAGEGTDTLRLQKQIKNLGLQKHVHYLGWQENLESLYDTCLALIFPSLWLEAFGLVLVDAMARGKPVIGSDRGSPTWLIKPEKNGYLFNPHSQGDLADKLLAAAKDPSKMMRMGIEAKLQISAMKTNADSLNEIVAIYRFLLKTNKSSSSLRNE